MADGGIHTGTGVDDRLTIATTLSLSRRRAEWLDGEKEYALDSQRHLRESRRARQLLSTLK